MQALARSSKVAVAKYAWSGRERLGLPRVRDDVIVLHSMHWPDESATPPHCSRRRPKCPKRRSTGQWPSWRR
ncbi:hypothetical protein ACFYO2_46015 [Streptomyces sp. NPDC006602]|uniref:hypothetical protein n=1 Tax=Streptomyces sp. NPDC006602 TaxID=3364751 RepID=UPI0036A06FB0